MNDASPAHHDKFRAYRARKKAKGLREIRMWVPDVNAPGFREALERQAAVIRASSEDQVIAAEMEAAIAEVWNQIP